MARARRSRETGLLWVLPAVVLVAAIMIYPLLHSLHTSLFSWNFLLSVTPRFVGLRNYLEALQAPEFWNALKVTTYMTLGVVGLDLLFGLGLAVFMSGGVRGKRLLTVAAIFPIVMTPVAIGVVWQIMLNPEMGIIPFLLDSVGFRVGSLLGQSSTALLTLIFVSTWKGTPFVFLVLLAAIQSLSVEMFEAARIDGARGTQVLRYITLPLLRPAILAVLLIQTMDSFKAFDLVYSLTAGGPGRSTQVLSLQIYESGFMHFEMGRASALSWMLVILTIVISLVYTKVFAESVEQ